jgi:5,10-methylenetetrahydromethanopterin reductase
MEFGTLIFTKPDRIAHDVPHAEARGFSHAWIPDSHMIWGDTYACMAIAAITTKRIKLGTGVAVASNRIAPVTVHSIASINQLAPGRTILGFGTGHTGRRVMGLPPVRHEDFREQVRVIHDLLASGEATYRTEGLERKIRFLHRDRRFINLDDKIPFYVAANGPKTLAIAGEFGDGIITTGVATPERVAAVRKHAQAGASKAGRDASKLPLVSLTHVCVLKPGEALDSPRVKAMTGHWVMASMHAIVAGYASPNSLPPGALPRRAHRALLLCCAGREKIRDRRDDRGDDDRRSTRGGARADPRARPCRTEPDFSQSADGRVRRMSRRHRAGSNRKNVSHSQ